MKIPKFRVWLPDPEAERMLRVKALVFENDKTRCVCGYAYDFYLEDENATIMQATGLFDKNGTEIFEGDILADVDESGDELVYLYVIYKDGKFMAVENEERGYSTDLVDCTTYHSVVGNIYENAELLGR